MKSIPSSETYSLYTKDKPNMSRTSLKNPETITIHTNAEQMTALRGYAASKDMSVGAVVRQAVKFYLAAQQTEQN